MESDGFGDSELIFFPPKGQEGGVEKCGGGEEVRQGDGKRAALHS
jgi:hypothetical protein